MPVDRGLFEQGVEHLKRNGADYGDIRWMRRTREEVEVRDSEPEKLVRSDSEGFGVRVLMGGGWGFSASRELTPEAVERVVGEAIETARASALTAKEPVKLAPVDPPRGKYEGPCEKDPFQVPLERKLSLLFEINEELLKGGKVAHGRATLRCRHTENAFFSTEGAETEQSFHMTGGGFEAIAQDGDIVQNRNYPTSFDGDVRQAGWEHVESLDLLGHASRVREEALQLLEAPECPSGTRDIIIGSSQLALQVHESCGHPTELDRVLGTELSFAGGSFLSLDKREKLRYGSDIVTIVADSTVPGGLGTFGWDDEGIPAQRSVLVDAGLFRNYLMSRETATVLGLPSNGCMRADGWNRIPLIRMINVNLESPADGPTLEELIADTKDGILVETNRSWSIDDLRLHFQFGCEAGWEIKNGKLGQLYRNPVYSGVTPEFWSSCDAICGPSEWRLWGLMNCGKGEPMQTMHVGHGAAPARFRKVQVGVRK